MTSSAVLARNTELVADNVALQRRLDALEGCYFDRVRLRSWWC
jgi:hypothetical protein